MSTPLKIGMIGLDTSHCTAFAKLLNDESDPHHNPCGRVTVAFPGGSPDFELSRSRLERFTSELRDVYQVEMVDSVEEVAERSDAILLTSVDGRVHLEQFKRIAPFGKPVFVDKPFAVSARDAGEMASIAKQYGVPLMSSSSLRYGEPFAQALQQNAGRTLIGADVYGPITLEPTQPGLFWYGIHCVEMLYAVLGRDCEKVQTVTNDDYELVTGVWQDGRIGTARGNRKGNWDYGVLMHYSDGSLFTDNSKPAKPHYVGLIERVMTLFQTGRADVDLNETIEIVRFIEAANESRRTGQTIYLH